MPQSLRLESSEPPLILLRKRIVKLLHVSDGGVTYLFGNRSHPWPPVIQ